MKAWKKVAQAFEWHTDHPIKGKMRHTMNRIVRAKLEAELIKEEKKRFDDCVERERFSRKLRF